MIKIIISKNHNEYRNSYDNKYKSNTEENIS